MKTLLKSLSSNLPKGNYKLFHIQSQPCQCKHLLIYHKKNAQKPELTVKVKHFISLIDDDDLVVMGIEVYVYLTIFDNQLKHSIFISKADTTGLSTRKYQINKLIDEILQYLIQYDIRDYCHKIRLKSKETVIGSGSNPTINSLNRIISKLQESTSYYKSIPYYNEIVIPATSTNLKTIVPPKRVQTSISLFTRASEQYLFPNSSKNERKHVIGGDDLLNWWIKLINRTLLSQTTEGNWDCKLHIPGSDNVSISKKLPDQSKNNVTWSIGSIFDKDEKKLAINQIPLFPDDPKGRFLEHLIVENRYKTTNLKQFWQELGFRQEFRLGNVVGIIGCEREELAITPTERDTNTCILSLSQYKKILNSIKSSDFNDSADIKDLVSVQIPDSMKEFGATNYYMPLDGSNDALPGTRTTPKVNNLNLHVKRKSDTLKEETVSDISGSTQQIPVNDISGSIKRKPVNDIYGSIKRKPVNDISASIKRKSGTKSSVEKTNNVPNNQENISSHCDSSPQTHPPNVNVINGLIRKKPKK